ncbi:sigma-70 family RNA polymerase sigma factor [Cloacibacillus evryensis]|uniref:RNA polymerase sigma factor SigS n=2 Tax=Cloacibacillus evryensis TaxID=508460 RepID=A0AAW5K6L9_9BACT|nr:sigma-70 family RNA polymerase sigma factor [Cloacibacillus evryensis]EHL70417.1 sigma-70 family RNA polymerase sigma factor [Synergistes sp. 3_1_syn1]MCQ4814173.1 sigma-70 family RNA polymerase sigma factor [Cloacibacillus evryensis]
MNGEAQVREIVDSYTPLVRATARRYEGRGADYEDLVQEGYLALLILIPKCPDMKWLAHFLKNNLPGLVRDAAARMRRGRAQGDEVLLEEIEETAGAEEEGYREAELRAILFRVLTPEELDLTQALLEGFKQREIAENLGVSQQAVAARLRKIKDKLKGIIASM